MAMWTTPALPSLAGDLRNAALEPEFQQWQDELAAWAEAALDAEIVALQRQHSLFFEELKKRLAKQKSPRCLSNGNNFEEFPEPPGSLPTLLLAPPLDEPHVSGDWEKENAQLSAVTTQQAIQPNRLTAPNWQTRRSNASVNTTDTSDTALSFSVSAAAFAGAVEGLLRTTVRNPHETGNCFWDFVTGEVFENVFVMVIMCNTAVMAVEAQFIGDATDHRIGYSGSGAAMGVEWQHAEATFQQLEWFFGIVFTIEMTIKIMALRLDVLKSPWNYLDGIVVMFFLLWAAAGDWLPKILVSLTRLARLLRIAKLLRALQDYDALYLMVTSLMGSLQVLAWSVVLLFLAQVFFALSLQLVVKDYLEDDTMDVGTLRELFKYFGSFLRCMLTMFEITFGNWFGPCRVLVENCSEWFMIFFITHLMVIGFATVAVINGIVINETFKVSEQDDKYMLMRQEQDNKVHCAKMKRLFDAADLDGSGAISAKQFAAICTFPNIRNWLSAMQIDFDHVDGLFELIDENGDRGLTVEELVQGVARLKGNAKAFELVDVRRKVVRMEHRVSEQLTELSCQMRSSNAQLTQLSRTRGSL